MIGTCTTISILLYRKYTRRNPLTQTQPKKMELQEIYAVPEPKARANQLPPQFTAKIIGGGCSSGGGVTHA